MWPLQFTSEPLKLTEAPADEGVLGRGWADALQRLRPSRKSEDEAEQEEYQSTGNLIVVSNRLPFSVKATDQSKSGYEFTMSSGGLVSAMLGVMEDESMTWIGWPGISVDDAAERDIIREQLAEDNCVPVFLDEKTADE